MDGDISSVSNPPTNDYFNSVSCAGTSFCTAVGSSGRAPTWSADLERGVDMDQRFGPVTGRAGGSLNAISCFSATSCTTVGGAGPGYTNTQALTWDGQTWTEVATPTRPTGTAGSEFFGVDCLTDWACVAAGGAIILGGPTFVPFEAMAPIARSGYRFVASDGGIFSYGAGAPFLGSTGGMALNKPIVGMAVMPAGDGYYLVASDGGIFNYGSAQFYGSMGGRYLNKPIVGMAVTGDGAGYWLVASDGGIFSFGDAQFYGSTGSLTLNKPIVGMATTPNGLGYYLVASDGGIFNYGNAAFEGSAGSLVLNKPVVGMSVPVSGGYSWWPLTAGSSRTVHLALLRLDGLDHPQQAGGRHGRRGRRLLLRGRRRRHLRLPEHAAVLGLARGPAPQRPHRGHGRLDVSTGGSRRFS